MRTVRKRQILKIMKLNAINLLREYFHHEHMVIVTGVRTLSYEREKAILDTLSSYAHILDRNYQLYTGVYYEEWVLLVSDFY